MAVLELERQVAVLELGKNFKQLSDHVNETKALDWERQLAVVELEGNFKRLSDRENETKALVKLVDDQIVNTRKAFFCWNLLVRNFLPLMRWRPDLVIGGTDHNSLRIGLTTLLETVVVHEGVRGLASPDPVLDALW